MEWVYFTNSRIHITWYANRNYTKLGLHKKEFNDKIPTHNLNITKIIQKNSVLLIKDTLKEKKKRRKKKVNWRYQIKWEQLNKEGRKEKWEASRVH